MTREEAIDVLRYLDDQCIWQEDCIQVGGCNHCKEAINMAIEALSEPNMIPIKLEKRYPKSRDEDITDAFMRGYLKGKADRPQGEWIDAEMDYGECSECGFFGLITDYCPNCGARNKGGNE